MTCVDSAHKINNKTDSITAVNKGVNYRLYKDLKIAFFILNFHDFL